MAVMASNQFTIKDLNDVTVATTQPSSPVNGMAWLDTSTTPPSIKVWNGTAWIKGSPTLASEIGAATTGDLSTQVIRIDDMMNDMKVTPLEKDELKRQWEQIKAEYTQNVAKGAAYGVSTTNYATAYTALNGTSPRIETDILASMTTTYSFASAAARDTFNSQLTAYWTQKEAFLKALADKQKALADAAQAKADDASGKINPVITPGGLLMGTKLSPNTVTATSIVIGDFTNMVAYNEVTNPGGQATTTANSKVYFKSGVAAWSKISFALSATKDFKKGDNFYFSFYGYRDATVVNAAFVVRYYYTDGTWTNAGRVEYTTMLTTETFIEQAVPITADPSTSKTLNMIEFFIEKDGTTAGSIYMRDLELRLMNKGNLIVDGSIYGKTITGGSINSALIRNSWTDAASSESGFIELATKAKGSNTPQLTVSYTSPGVTGRTELYGFGMKIKAMGYDLIFNNFNSTMGIDAYNNDLRMGSSRGLRFFPDWNGVNSIDYRHFYMITEEPTITYFGAEPTKARQMVLGVANDGDLTGTTTGGHMVIRSGSGYVVLQPEANNTGNNNFVFSIQESDYSSGNHGMLSYGSTVTQNGQKSALRFRKDVSGVEVVNTGNAESSSSLGFIKASNFYSDGNTVLQADDGYVVIRTTKTDSPIYLQSNLESRSVAVNTTTTYKPFRASSFPVGSSINYKQNLEKIEETDIKPLDLVMRTQVWKYHLNSNIDSGVYDKPKVGLISEMVEPIVRDQDGVDPYSIASVAWGAIQEQQRMIEKQQAQIDYLKEMVALLSDKLN